MQAVILAGGLGTRLGAITQTTPKAMVVVAGQPFLHWQIELLRREGIKDIVILVAHFADQIQSSLGDGSRFGVHIRYSHEGVNLLDTAGAIRAAIAFLSDSFFVTFGDSFLELPYRKIWQDYKAACADALMVVYRNDNQFDTSDLTVDNGLVTAYRKYPPLERATYINHGLMIVRRADIAKLEPRTPISLQSFFQSLIARGRLMAWETNERFYEIGSVTGLSDLESRLMEPRKKP